MKIEQIYTYCKVNGLEGHLEYSPEIGIETSGGSLGLGLSFALGKALALHYVKKNTYNRVFCILGDGECNEGQVWEAAMAASHYKLDNLIAIVDYNKVMAKGFVHELMGIEPLTGKWATFGWEVIEIDGHDINDILNALYQARYIKVHGKPILILAHTVKGKGIPEAEFNCQWHTHAPNPTKADEMLRELARYYGREEEGYSKLVEYLTEGSELQ